MLAHGQRHREGGGNGRREERATKGGSRVESGVAADIAPAFGPPAVESAVDCPPTHPWGRRDYHVNPVSRPDPPFTIYTLDPADPEHAGQGSACMPLSIERPAFAEVGTHSSLVRTYLRLRMLTDTLRLPYCVPADSRMPEYYCGCRTDNPLVLLDGGPLRSTLQPQKTVRSNARRLARVRQGGLFRVRY